MGSAIICFHDSDNENDKLPVSRLPGSTSEVKTTNASTSVPSTTAAAKGCFVTVTAVGANLWVTAGPTPVAAYPAVDGAVGAGFPILSGSFQTFSIKKGDKVACKEFT